MAKSSEESDMILSEPSFWVAVELSEGPTAASWKFGQSGG